MVCTKCGKAVADGIAFCPECGAQISKADAAPVATAIPAVTPKKGKGLNLSGIIKIFPILGILGGLVMLGCALFGLIFSFAQYGGGYGGPGFSTVMLYFISFIERCVLAVLVIMAGIGLGSLTPPKEVK